MPEGFLKENFSFGVLASTLNAAAVTLTVTAGHTLPTASGTFRLVIWDSVSFPNPSDDAGVEIVTGEYSGTPNIYDITRAQESTSDVEHAASEKVGLHYTAGVNVDDLDAANHPMARVAGSTFSTVQHLQDINHSAGWISGNGVTDDADGTITVAAGTGLLRAIDSSTAEILFIDWPAESGVNVDLVDDSINWVYVEYNSGTPRVVATTTERTDYNTNILIASISRDGTTLHINHADLHVVGDHANAMIRRLKETMPYARVSGGIISESGTIKIAVTEGNFWRGLTEFTTDAFDSNAAGRFTYFYRLVGDSGWVNVDTQDTINNTQYDDNSGSLATLANNRYGVHWVYMEVDGHVSVIYGRGSYTLLQAEDAQPPASVPDEIAVHGFLVGKIIIQENTSVFTKIESAFETTFQGSVPTAHSSLTQLDFASAGHTGENPIANGGTGQSTAQGAIDAISAVSGATNEHVLTKDTGTGNAIFKAAAASGDNDKVGVDAGATAGFLGVADDDGVLRTGAGITYVDGGDFVTLAVSGTYVDRGDPSSDDFAVGDFTTDFTWRDLDLSSIVPAGAASVYLHLTLQDGAAGSLMQFRKNGQTNSFNLVTALTQVVDLFIASTAVIKLDAGRIIEYRASNTTFDIINVVVLGWWI